MQHFVDFLSFILPLCAGSVIVFIFVVNVYLKLRRIFPVNVNCWFCNTWNKVPYENKNSFDCPNCLQYNGFTQDGDYNKVIEAQFNCSSNKVEQRYLEEATNGLCNSCNTNQHLKINQLARFSPMKEENYDEEIEHFRNQLEKAYQLCKRCDKVLKYTLMKEKAFLLTHKLKSIKRNGLRLLDLTKPANGFSAKQKQMFVVEISKKLQRLFAVLFILNINMFILNSLQIPKILEPYVELFEDCSQITSNILKRNNLLHFNHKIENGSLIYLSLIGFVLEMVIFFLDKNTLMNRLNVFLCWSFLIMVSFVPDQELFVFIYVYQMLCSCLIFYSSFKNPNITQRLFFKTNLREQETDLKYMNDFSDEEIDDYSSIKSKMFMENLENSNNSNSDVYNLSLNGSKPYTAKTKSVHSFTTANNLNSTFKITPNNSFLTNDISRYSIISNKTENGRFSSPLSVRPLISPSILSPNFAPISPQSSTNNINKRWSTNSSLNNSFNVTFPTIYDKNVQRTSNLLNTSHNASKSLFSEKLINSFETASHGGKFYGTNSLNNTSKSLFSEKLLNSASNLNTTRPFQQSNMNHMISPSKKSWVAGGFWASKESETEPTKLSRSSSQESGFASNKEDNPNLLCVDFDKCSIESNDEIKSVAKSKSFVQQRLF